LLPAYLYKKVERAQPESLLNTKFSASCDNKCSASYFTLCFFFVVIVVIIIIIISILVTPTSFPTNTSVSLCHCIAPYSSSSSKIFCDRRTKERNFGNVKKNDALQKTSIKETPSLFFFPRLKRLIQRLVNPFQCLAVSAC
jgi:hypothetical protein